MDDLQILENIMKPYFDKKAQIDNAPVVLENEKLEVKTNIDQLRSERIAERKKLELELEQLRVRRVTTVKDFEERKEREIEEYINEVMNSKPNLTVTYGSFVRKDLEKEYNKRLEDLLSNFKAREDSLSAKIKELKNVSLYEKIEKQQLDSLNNQTDFSRVDLREVVEIKDKIRKQLNEEKRRLNAKLTQLKPEQELYQKITVELKETQAKFNEIMDNLSNFKYEYNDQNQVVNAHEWRKLYEESSVVAEKITELTTALADKMSLIQELDGVNKALLTPSNS